MQYLNTTRSARIAFPAFTLLACLLIGPGEARAQAFRSTPDPGTYQWRDLSKELANKMTGDYIFVSVGDMLYQEPASQRIGKRFVDLFQGADTTFGNLEGYLVDRQLWAGSNGYRNNWAPKELARDLAGMGFDFVGPGEADGGEAGQLSTMKYLDEVGIKRAGYGPNLTIARQPAFQELPQGRVAMISALPIGAVADGPAARNKTLNNYGEVAGMNPLRLTVWNTVTEEQFEQLKAIRQSILDRRDEPDVARPTELPKDESGKLSFLGKNYLISDKPGEYHYEMHPSDVQAQTLAVRNAKEYADFVFYSMHVHENRYAFQAYSQDHYPANYVRELVHKLIDNGLDMYVGHGNHTMQGIEIYKGRPIFYNHGNFAVQRFGSEDSPPNSGNLTFIETYELRDSWLQQYINMVAYAAESIYEDGLLTEVRIYPADLGVNQDEVPWSRSSIAQTPSLELAGRILAELQEYSAPFGTKIEIRNGVGIIRVSPSDTIAVGQDLDIPGRGPNSGGSSTQR